MNKNYLNEILALSEEFFHTANDPFQIPLVKEAYDKIIDLYSGAIEYHIVNGEPVSWIIVIPTQRVVAEKFLDGELTERELLENTRKEERYDALYLETAFTIPKYRRKGLAIPLVKKAVEHAPLSEDALFFAWAYSPAGKALLQKIEVVLGKALRIKE